MKDICYAVPTSTNKNYFIMGKEFDVTKPEEYINSFAIRRS